MMSLSQSTPAGVRSTGIRQGKSTRDSSEPLAAGFGEVELFLTVLSMSEYLRVPGLLRGQMGQLATLDRVGLDSMVGARANAVCRIRTGGHATSVDCYGRKISFPVYASGAVRFALNHSQFVVRELPGDLDDT